MLIGPEVELARRRLDGFPVGFQNVSPVVVLGYRGERKPRGPLDVLVRCHSPVFPGLAAHSPHGCRCLRVASAQHNPVPSGANRFGEEGPGIEGYQRCDPPPDDERPSVLLGCMHPRTLSAMARWEPSRGSFNTSTAPYGTNCYTPATRRQGHQGWRHRRRARWKPSAVIRFSVRLKPAPRGLVETGVMARVH